MGLSISAMEQPQAASQDGMYGSRRSRLQKMESRLTAHMDSEDRRVKELTEGILYDFLPAALNVMLPRCEDHLQELDADRCRAVASAALAVSALMNAPAGFLEFLLCVPWRKLSQLYPKTPNLAARSDSIDKLVSNLQVTDEERRKLVNTRIDPALMGTVLDFLYKDKHADSVPPMLQLTPVNPLQPDDKSAPLVVRETVAAVLDGATPLHCAALRGNPAQVDHLLYCGAEPTLKTASGELPIELVPVCSDGVATASSTDITAASSSAVATPVHRNCRCMGPHDQEVWECRSHLARSLIARRCFFSFGVGLLAWLRLMIFCLLCLLGQVGCYTSIIRPVVDRHIDARRQQKVAAARARAHALVTRMRFEAEAGLRHLEQAKRECMESAAFQRGPPDISQMCFTDPNKIPPPPPPPPPISQVHDINFHLQESGTSSTGEELASEKAFKCFVRSVHALQSLDLHGDVVPQVFAELVAAGAAESRETHVLEDEQAELYSCWAESVLLKFRGCTCPGCAALAIQAVRMAHIQATRLFGKVDRVKQSHAERWRAVGQALARVVYVHICLLLETEAQASPTRSLVWRAEQCLREWDRLEKAGLTQGAGVLDPRHVAALQLWAKTADSDLYLAEALHGQAMPPTKTLQEVVQASVTYGADSTPILARPVSTEVVGNLEQAITLSSLPSPMLAHIVRGVVANAVAELAAAARLREFVGARGAAALGGAGSGTSEAVAALTEALRAAEPFRSRLGPELDAAQDLHARWTQRAQALEKLEGAVDEVRAYAALHPLSFSVRGVAVAFAASAPLAAATSDSGADSGARRVATQLGPRPGSLTTTATPCSTSASSLPKTNGHASPSSAAGSSGGGEGNNTSISSSADGAVAAAGTAGGEGTPAPDMVEWERRMKQLEAAMNDAKDANVSVTKAKRLLKEMAAVAAAAEASRQLEAVMARRPSGPMQLKLALNKAEAAASTLSSLGGSPVPGLTDVLGPLMTAARRRVDTERAAEALSKAAASFRTLADLARLEAAIYNAKKIGAEELDPESYRTSLELRAHLQEAARMRTGLETALRNLQNQLRSEDAEALERALQDAAKWEDLLAPDIAKARKALEHWRAMTVSDAKLARLLHEGASTGVLARAIQEAAASGVKVQQAKRVLKLMQALESVLAGVDGGPAERYAAIKSKLEAAEQGGVTAGPVPETARRTLARLAAQAAREELEAALKPHSDWSTAQRVGVLQEALEKAEGVLSGAAKEQHEQPSDIGEAAPAEGETVGPTAAAASLGSSETTMNEDGPKQPQQIPKLANGSVVGRVSRGKRGNSGSIAGGFEATAQVANDNSPGVSELPTPSTPVCGSNSDNSNSAATNNVSIICGGSAGAAGVDDEALTAVRELASKARRVLEEDQAELARIEHERQEAERTRKEAQERERQERLRQEQERQKREKAEAAERERLLAEKRERAKAEKTRQLHQQQNHLQHQQHKMKLATAAVEPANVMGQSGGDKPNGAAKALAASKAGGKGGPNLGASNGAANTRIVTTTVTVCAVSVPVGKPDLSRDLQAHPMMTNPRAAQGPAPAGSKALTGQAAAAAISPMSTAILSPAAPGGLRQPRGHPPEATHDLFSAQLLSPPEPAVSDRILTVVPAGRAIATLHTRGDSLESLGEVVHTLNKEVIEALDMDHDVNVPHVYSPTCTGATTVSGGADAGGGSATRTISGVTAAAESTLDGTPSQRTSSGMSSMASADDVILQSAGAGAGCAGLDAGVSASIISGAGSLSTISSGQPVASSANLDVLPRLPTTDNPAVVPESANACGAGGTGTATITALGGGGGGSGGGMAAKPRFGFVDLGGASWGLDSPILTGSSMGSASLFTSAIGEFGSMLCTSKPDGAGAGWHPNPLGGGSALATAVPGALMFNGQPAPQGVGGGPADDVAALLGSSVTARHTFAGGGGGNGLHIQVPDVSLTGLVPVHASPRTTVATASANAHGIVQVRPLGAGGMPGTGPPLVQLPPGMAVAATTAGVGGGSNGRSSLHLQLPQQHSGQQPQAGNGPGLVARSGFWTPPFQTAGDMNGDATVAAGSGCTFAAGPASSLQPGNSVGQHHVGLTSSAACPGIQVLDWQQQSQQQTDTGLQLVHLGGVASTGPSGGGGSSVQLRNSATAAAIPGTNRACRFFLQGYCRDGERCRFAHHAAQGGVPIHNAHGAVGGGTQLLQLSQGSTSPLSQHHLLGHVGGFPAARDTATAAAAGGVVQSSAVGSFAFGAPGAEAFAPVGHGGGMAPRTSTGIGPAASGELSAGEQQQLLAPKGIVPQQRHGGVANATAGNAGVPGLPQSLVLLDRSQLGSQSLPMGGLTGGGSSGGMVLGSHQQHVQLRDSATGATFAAVLTIPGAPTGGSFHPKQLQYQQHQQTTAQQHTAQPQQQQQQQQQQALLLALPDDLSYSPP
ncbi:hypothetical protein VaNZ11_001399 [Volvox africanus]|uniref:C3H1-type domain-containing protein n=1 Tax=Volvox africanus TaxID=51714 RepID=A0ABQ5RPM1_9CHLO|nr:hypothetical protein VaNZ11_001399 [Volvox africanus]